MEEEGDETEEEKDDIVKWLFTHSQDETSLDVDFRRGLTAAAADAAIAAEDLFLLLQLLV